jgi:hypothetical protein
MALVGCGLPMYGHDVVHTLDRGSAVGFTVRVLVAVGVRMATRKVSFPRLVGLVVAAQLAMHALLEVSIDRRVPGQVWTYHPHLPALDWVAGYEGTARMLASHLLIDLLVAAVLYGFETNVWAWFCLAALRLRVANPEPAPLPTPNRPVLRPVYAAPAFRPLLWVSASGRRGPPLPAL